MERDVVLETRSDRTQVLPRFDIQGIQVDNLKIDEATAMIAHALERHAPTRVAFLNAHCANVAAKNDDYRTFLDVTELVLPDGRGIEIAAALKGVRMRENANGTDLFPVLCRKLALSDHRVYLLGGRPGIADGVARWMTRHYPGIRIVGSEHGHFSSAEEPEVCEQIRSSGADVLLVAMGVPRQELWIQQWFEGSGVTVALAVGGLFDFYSGRIPRAPRWIRRIGMEWTFRLAMEPRRLWRRYLLGNLSFLGRALRDRGRKRGARP